MNYSTPFELPTRKERFELEKWKHLNIKAEIEKNRVEVPTNLIIFVM